MSQNWHKLSNGREILYGFDAPTGGFFLSEFYSEEEMKNKDAGWKDNVVLSYHGMMLSDFEIVFRRYDFCLDIHKMIEQLRSSKYPTQHQMEMGKIFGQDVVRSLELVGEDLMKNWVEHLVE